MEIRITRLWEYNGVTEGFLTVEGFPYKFEVSERQCTVKRRYDVALPCGYYTARITSTASNPVGLTFQKVAGYSGITIEWSDKQLPYGSVKVVKQSDFNFLLNLIESQAGRKIDVIIRKDSSFEKI